MKAKKIYDLYDGDECVGRFDINEICDILGTTQKYAYRICGESIRYKGRFSIWRVETAEGNKAARGLPAEWKKATAQIREVIGVEKRILEVWDKTVRPFHRRPNSIWRF